MFCWRFQSIGNEAIKSRWVQMDCKEAPNAILYRATTEHSIWGPFGTMALADAGRVADSRGGLGFRHFLESYGIGLTIHGGGIPQFTLMFAFGGNGGNHTIAVINPGLFGGMPRPHSSDRERTARQRRNPSQISNSRFRRATLTKTSYNLLALLGISCPLSVIPAGSQVLQQRYRVIGLNSVCVEIDRCLPTRGIIRRPRRST